MIPSGYVLAREFFCFYGLISLFLDPNPISTSPAQIIRLIQEAFGLLPSRIQEVIRSQRGQFTMTLAAVLLLIIIKGPGSGQPGIVGSVVRQYIEETSASIIPSETSNEFSDIQSLMSSYAVHADGHGHENTQGLYILRDDAVHATDVVSMDYLDDYKENKVIEYTVQPGDVLSFIASDFGVSSNSILWANKLTSPDSIKPGQTLRIPPVSGVIHAVKKGDTVSTLAKQYKADEARILAFNELQEDDVLKPGTDLIIPDGTVPLVKVIAAAKTPVTAAAKRFSYLPDLADFFMTPTSGFNWGTIHGRNGVDVAAACGTPVYAAAGGTASLVDVAGWNGGFGKYIKLTHPNGTETLYAHLNKHLVASGEEVVKGQQIGLMGTTGRSTGCHLHFEVHGARNPLAKY